MPTRLLLIEDNPGDALIFREKLNESNLDYELVHTQRLQEGLDLIESESFDLILVDLSLPDASGLEAVVQVINAAPERPVIVLTGLDDANIAAQARQEGAIDYLVKWYHDGPSLARYVRYAIAQMRMQREGRLERPGPPSEGEEAADIAPPPEASSPEAPPPEAPRSSAPASASDAEALRAALDPCEDGVAIVSADGRIRYANDRAREWLGATESYPWPLETGFRRISAASGELAQDAIRTRWEDQGAFVVTLRAAEEVQRRAGPQVPLLEIAEAALSFATQSEQRARWMTGLLRMALELEQQEMRGLRPSATLVDLVDRVQMVARELHATAMARGTPINVKASREKISASVDRQLAEMLIRRVMLDAVLTAHGSVDAEVSIIEGRPQLILSWEPSLPDWAALPSAARSLSRRVVERLAARAGGACDQHEEGGRDVTTIILPANQTG